jgi:hypothetical protein
MTITFQKRQKEMKRLEKQRTKAERREQRKLAKRAEHEASAEVGVEVSTENVEVTTQPEPQG